MKTVEYGVEILVQNPLEKISFICLNQSNGTCLILRLVVNS